MKRSKKIVDHVVNESVPSATLIYRDNDLSIFEFNSNAIGYVSYQILHQPYSIIALYADRHEGVKASSGTWKFKGDHAQKAFKDLGSAFSGHLIKVN